MSLKTPQLFLLGYIWRQPNIVELTFIRDICLPVRETGRFVLYPGDSRIIRVGMYAYI